MNGNGFMKEKIDPDSTEQEIEIEDHNSKGNKTVADVGTSDTTV